MKIGGLIAAIERRRGSRVLVLAASHLDTDLLPALHDTLRALGPMERLDVLISCRGGAVGAARAMAVLLHQFAGHLTFIVPDRCTSAGTILALAGHEIVAGPAAIFSPVDPLLQGPLASGDEAPGAISAQDVRLFGEMSRAWFGLAEDEARLKALSLLCDNIFPTSLSAFYRATLEVEAVCLELLSLHMPERAREAKARIVERLLFGYHSHAFPLMRGDLAALGLPLIDDPATADDAWEVARLLRDGVGGAARASAQDDWTDALLATREGLRRRRRRPDGIAPAWEQGAVA
jgi:hypothetical protein